MPKDDVPTHDNGGDTQGSSQSEVVVAQAAEGPRLRSREDGRTKYDERNDIDAEASSTLDEAGDEYVESQEDILAKKASIENGETSRTLRSRPARQEPVEPTEQTQGLRVVIKPKKRTCNDDDEPELQRPAKRGRKPSANTEIKRFDKDLQGLRDKYTSKAQESESLTFEVRDLRDQIKGLETKVENQENSHNECRVSLKEAIDRLRGENDRLQVTNENLQCEEDKLRTVLEKRTSQLLEALEENKRDSIKYVKVSDSDILDQWKLLSYNVRNLVSQYVTEQPSNQHYTLRSLLKWEQFRSSEDALSLRVNILRKATWKSLVSAVFSGYRSVWQGELGHFLTHSLSGKDHASIKDPRYFEIISQTKSRVVADLDEESHLDQDALRSEVERVWRELKLFIPKAKGEKFKETVKGLFTQAVELHTIMMKSKAIFQVKWIGDKDGTDLTTYDPATMEPSYGDGDADAYDISVRFVEAPGLVKIGNADGENFDQSMVLCKSRVILGDEVEKVVLVSDS